MSSLSQRDNSMKLRSVACSSDNKRRTRYVQSTSEPEWHQTLVFMNLTRQQLASQTLELTVWDYDRFKTHDFLGELSLNMSGMVGLYSVCAVFFHLRLKPKFQYADFHRNFPAGKVADINHKSPPHKSWKSATWFMSQTLWFVSAAKCTTLSQSWRNGIWALHALQQWTIHPTVITQLKTNTKMYYVKTMAFSVE